MPTNKRITDLTDYTSILPYASEMFGVYQPMIGWKSKRIMKRFKEGLLDAQSSLLRAISKSYKGVADVTFDPRACAADFTNVEIGKGPPPQSLKENQSVLLQCLARSLPTNSLPTDGEWKALIKEDTLETCLAAVKDFYKVYYNRECERIKTGAYAGPGVPRIIATRLSDLQTSVTRLVKEESAIAGALLGLAEQSLFTTLESVFYKRFDSASAIRSQLITDMLNTDDPFATFDPKKDVQNVSLSPLGIVHLFRQFFFELDTFLGTPTAHVWLSPGSSVELIEVSTRRVYVEKIIEQSTEATQKSETSTTNQDEIADAVKEDNKSDLKLGASLTVNQSWGTGSATATGSLSMDRTQDTARENTHKRMREQTQKLSSEIKHNFKSTFKTVTETTDTSSKRYVLNNTTPNLINYELRRKMRQVGVQVQDIGTYLCWETFVDEPGRQLGLSNLVHIAKPADVKDVPASTDIQYPPDKTVPFTANVQWNFGDNRQFNNPDFGFLPITTIEVPPAPQGYEVKFKDGFIDVFQVSAAGEDFEGVWAFRGKMLGASQISIGPWIASGGMEWDELINFVVGGVVIFKPDAATLKAIDTANAASVAAGIAATTENARKLKEAFLNAAKERIEIAGDINTRKSEDLREEERIIVYRNLIGTLMSDTLYKMPEGITNDRIRHTLSELLNSIFDIDKMLYFVAPEWWKPRRHYHQSLGSSATNYDTFTGNLTSWSDLEIRPDNYFITEKSRYARMGSSLGWLLQLDGDNMRNAFLNAPWVKAVIPIRPGKELEATNWLQQMHVEGTEGLDGFYHASESELQPIRDALNIRDVTIGDAIKYLCADVAAKHAASLKVDKYPKEEINDDNKVSATPIEKVYEHGFYPLPGGFRAVTQGYHEVFDQWIEVLPTDQVVPVEVSYDPKTGRQL
jgi:hypothetical protein